MRFSGPLITALIVLLLIGFLYYQQSKPRPIFIRRLIIVPFVLLFFIIRSYPSFNATQTNNIELFISIIASLIFGMLACRQLKVFPNEKTHEAMTVGTWKYFLWWLAAFLVKIILTILFGQTNTHNFNQFEFMVSPFLLILTRNIYLYNKAVKIESKVKFSRKST